MAIGRISGPMLRANLERQGVDLSIDTDLLYVDVNNSRIGINTAIPEAEFDLAGIALFNSNLKIDGTVISSENTNGNISIELNGNGTLNVSNLTSSRVVFVGTNGALIDSENLTFDGNDLFVGGNTVLDAAQLGNLDITGNTISATNTNGDIVLDPNGVGTVNVVTLTEGRIVFVGADGSLIDSENLTFDGNSLFIGGDVVLDNAALGNLSINGNTISSSNTNGDIVLDPNGTGNVILESATPDRVLYTGANNQILTDNVLTYNGSTLGVANINISGSTLSNTDVDGDLTLDVNGTGTLIVDTNTGIKFPIGTTLQRPADVEGYVRYNSDTNSIEFYNGVNWLSIATASGTSLFETFDGDNSTTNFTLSSATTTNDTIVTLNGVVQSPGNAYAISGTDLTFTEAPKSGDAIEVRFITSEFTPASIIQDNDSSVRVNDSSANIVSKINGSNVIVTTDSSTTFNGSIFGIGSIASIKTVVPVSNNSSGVKGEIAYDSDYVYICVATDTWIRADIDNTF
jgi:hypothetical protein